MPSNSSKKMDLSPIKQISKGTTDRQTQNNEIETIEKQMNSQYNVAFQETDEDL